MLRRLLLLVAVLLAACEPSTSPKTAPRPPSRPPSEEPAAPPPTPRFEVSETEAYYRRIEQNYLANGQERTDGGQRDAPFGVREVVQNFLDIALFTEYGAEGNRLEDKRVAIGLERWAVPVRMRLEAGPAVRPEMIAKDRGDIASYARQLSRVSHHPVAYAPDSANFVILLLTEDERRASAPLLKRLMPDISPAAMDKIINMNPSDYCLNVSSTDENSSQIVRGLAIVRAELPDLLRLSCYNEELAQGLGLYNDSPRARPSIFNDDEEFALLTPMDEILLRILYDSRLHPGMSADEARPVVQAITEEILGEAG